MPAHRVSEEEHALRGTAPEYENKPVANSGRPRVPRHLSKDAKKIFRDICRKLLSRRALTPADGAVIELVAQLIERHRRAVQHVATEGEICSYTRLDSNGQAHEMVKRNLWLDIAEDCEGRIAALLDRLGFTPMTRPKTVPTKPAESNDGIVFK